MSSLYFWVCSSLFLCRFLAAMLSKRLPIVIAMPASLGGNLPASR